MSAKSAASAATPGKRAPAAQADRRATRSTRDALVAAAAEIFNTVGYYGTDSNRIARAAGFAPGTFYTHFPDKLAIFLEVYKQWVRIEWAAIEDNLKAGLDRPALRRRLSRAVLEHHRKWRTFRAGLRALSATDERVHAARVAQRELQIATMAELLRARGLAVPSRARILSLLLIFEALCDAVVDGDAHALGVADAEILDLLDESLSL